MALEYAFNVAGRPSLRPRFMAAASPAPPDYPVLEFCDCHKHAELKLPAGFSSEVRGMESFREEIRKGHLSLPLQQLKDLPEDPDGCSEFERLFVADLEQAQKVLLRVLTKSEDPRLSSRPYRAQAHLLCAGLLSRLPAFTKTLKQIHDHSGRAVW